MKKILALLLAAVTCVSLAACGSTSTETTTAAETTAEATETTAAETTTAEETTTEAKAATGTIELTNDNWQDYFELKEICVPTTDADGNDTLARAEFLVFKDGYTLGGSAEDSPIQVEYSYTINYKMVEIDVANSEIKVGLECDGYDDKGETKTLTTPSYFEESKHGFRLETDGAWTMEDGQTFMQILEDLTITNISGTIEIVEVND